MGLILHYFSEVKSSGSEMDLCNIKRSHREIDINIGQADDADEAEFDESVKVSDFFCTTLINDFFEV